MPSTTVISGVQYSGIWTMQQVNAAVAAGTWTGLPYGYLYSWGRNNAGQLGVGNTTNYSSPKQVGALVTWTKIAVGGSASFGWSIATKLMALFGHGGQNESRSIRAWKHYLLF